MVRLLVTNRADFVHGEVIDVQTEQASRFTQWSQLEPLVRAVLREALRRQAGGLSHPEKLDPQ